MSEHEPVEVLNIDVMLLLTFDYEKEVQHVLVTLLRHVNREWPPVFIPEDIDVDGVLLLDHTILVMPHWELHTAIVKFVDVVPIFGHSLWVFLGRQPVCEVAPSEALVVVVSHVD